MIEAQGLTYGYAKGLPVIQHWSATIGEGEAVAIVGGSGSGKSTLLYLLGALARPWSGRLRIDGVDVVRASDRVRSDLRAGRIGFVFQDSFLDQKRSIVDNVIEGAVYAGLDRSIAIRRARALLSDLGVAVDARRSAAAISGGQAQRAALCRALLLSPRIILADEPTGNLDRTNAAVVADVLLAHARSGGTLVLVTHDEALAERCDRVFRL